MRLLKQNTARTVMVFMTDAVDHVTGKTGLTLTISLSKDGAAFATLTPTITERGNGWYAVALTTSHTDTIGDFALRATAAGADPTDIIAEVRPRLLDDVAFPVVTGRGLDVDGLGGVGLTAAAIDAVHDELIEGAFTHRQLMRLVASSLAGKLSGAATTAITIRDVNDSKTRIAATVDASGNRTALTLDAT